MNSSGGSSTASRSRDRAGAGGNGPGIHGTCPETPGVDGSSTCPITSAYAIRSGVPLIGLGILLILAGFLGYLVPGFPVPPLPVPVIFAGFGLFLIWAGLTK